MTDEVSAVTQRRERLGMTKSDLASEAEVHRNTLAAIEDGEGGHRNTLAKVLRTLDALELEAGLEPLSEVATPPQPHIRVIKIQIGDVAVEGPVETEAGLAELEASALRLSRQSRGLPPE